MPHTLLFSLFATLLVALDGLAQNITQNITLTHQQIALVLDQLDNATQYSWEIGTRAQVLIEYNAPEFSVMSSNCSFPLPTTAPNLDTPLQIAKSVVAQKPENILPLFFDGSSADPASAGPIVLIANWTGLRDQNYAAAAEQQLDYLLNHAPRYKNGAISHRNDSIQLWSDFIYMVPPFLAMYGAIQRNTTVMDEAYNQIKLYREVLCDGSGLWKHIIDDGDGLDKGHWSTGNGWAALGMLRVAGTYRSYGFEYGNLKSDLLHWAAEILDAMYAHTALANTTLFHNYVDQDSTFLDASSTAAIAAATYHLAVLSDEKGTNNTRLGFAERARRELSFGGHIDGDGWLSPVVDPYNFPLEGSHSAEGQAFVVSMLAGYQEWLEIERRGTKRPGIEVPGTQERGAQGPVPQEQSTQEQSTQAQSTQVQSTQVKGTQVKSTQEQSTEGPGASSASHASVSAGPLAALAALACILA